jgi:hypothetical protein
MVATDVFFKGKNKWPGLEKLNLLFVPSVDWWVVKRYSYYGKRFGSSSVGKQNYYVNANKIKVYYMHVYVWKCYGKVPYYVWDLLCMPIKKQKKYYICSIKLTSGHTSDRTENRDL